MNSVHSSGPFKIVECQICHIRPSLYRCPRCSMRTCSLTCCTVHKKNQNCNGKRDRSTFCSLHNFTNSQLKSDFHFLEDALKVSSVAKKMLGTMGAHQEKKTNHKRKISEVVPAQPLLSSDKTFAWSREITTSKIRKRDGDGDNDLSKSNDEWLVKCYPRLQKLVFQAR